MTHVIVSGPKDAPPLVLLHGYMATSAMWSPNIGDFSKDYRVYAIDVMGQPSKSIPAEPIRDRGRLRDVVDGDVGRTASRPRLSGGHVVRGVDSPRLRGRCAGARSAAGAVVSWAGSCRW